MKVYGPLFIRCVCLYIYIYMRVQVCVCSQLYMHIDGVIVFKHKKIWSYMEKVSLSWMGHGKTVLMIQGFKIPNLPFLANIDQLWLTLTGIRQKVDQNIQLFD